MITFRKLQASRWTRRLRRIRGHKDLFSGLLYGALAITNVVAVVTLTTDYLIPNHEFNRNFRPTKARIIEIRTAIPSGDSSAIPQSLLQFEAANQTYRVWTEVKVASTNSLSNAKPSGSLESPLSVGDQIDIWYHREDPQQITLQDSSTWWAWTLFLVCCALAFVGAQGVGIRLLRNLSSEELRSATRQRVSRELTQRVGMDSDEYPFVPQPTNQTDSPGTQLKFRLPAAQSRVWEMWAIVFITSLWNLVAIILAFYTIKDYSSGSTDLWHICFALIAVAIGIWLIWFLIRRAHRALSVGATRIEISEHPFRPGGEYEAVVSHQGSAMLKSITATLVCDEKVSYHQGTDTRRETYRSREMVLFRESPPGISGEDIFEKSVIVHIPEEAPHSFLATHNEIAWSLVIDIRVTGQRGSTSSFPIIVFPPQASNISK